MQAPPEYLMPVLQSIESAAIKVKREFPKTEDKDAEYVYGKLKDYYLAEGRGKNRPEPTSTIERKQILIDEILNALDERIEEKADNYIINDDAYTDNGKPFKALGFLYNKVFRQLEDSARYWRKNPEYGGYWGYLENFMP